MARYHFPGKPAKRAARIGHRSLRIPSGRLPFSCAKLLLAENTGRCLSCFEAILHESAEEVRTRRGGEGETREIKLVAVYALVWFGSVSGTLCTLHTRFVSVWYLL
jgi:hypothetical protein